MCKHPTIVTDYRSGDRICNKCGMIMEESIVQDEIPEYREFKDCDNESKQRVGKAESIFLTHKEHEFTRDADEKLFYDTGLQMMDEFFASEFQDTRPKKIQARSRELFDYAFKCQKEQKQGDRPFGHHDPLYSSTSGGDPLYKRQKYSLKKTFIIASIWIACNDYNYFHDKLSLPYLCNYFQKHVTETKAKQVFAALQKNTDEYYLQKTQMMVSQQKQIRNSQRRHFDRSKAKMKTW